MRWGGNGLATFAEIQSSNPMNPIPSNGTPDRRAGALLEVQPVWWAGFVSRVAAALVAGTIAIASNILALDAAWLVPLDTGNGGLLRFLVMLTGGAFPAPAGAVFQTGFHFVVGLRWLSSTLSCWNPGCARRVGYAEFFLRQRCG